MVNKADVRRRVLGATFLAGALATLVAGLWVLRNPLIQIISLILCLVFTCLSIVVAFRDFSAIRRSLREEQRELLEKTLNEIAQEKQSRKSKTSGPGEI
jgi:hypothetical protein